jgi:hypothetical protein
MDDSITVPLNAVASTGSFSIRLSFYAYAVFSGDFFFVSTTATKRIVAKEPGYGILFLCRLLGVGEKSRFLTYRGDGHNDVNHQRTYW